MCVTNARKNEKYGELNGGTKENFPARSDGRFYCLTLGCRIN